MREQIIIHNKPEVWDAIPNEMGHNAWGCIIATLKLLKINF